jgi:hypothetical protein
MIENYPAIFHGCITKELCDSDLVEIQDVNSILYIYFISIIYFFMD